MVRRRVKYILIGVAVILLIKAGTYLIKDNVDSNTNTAMTLTIAFHKEDPLTCSVTEDVERSIPYSDNKAGAALKELFSGPSVKEKAKGLSSTFNPQYALAATFLEKEAAPLSAYYRGVSVKNSVAIVDFSREALAYLNSPACAQAAVKSPIIETLLNIPGIKQVEFSIDGEIYNEWDA